MRILKAGSCTVQFNAFLQAKTVTQLMSGGNTEEFYAKEGTFPKSRMLVRAHPDVARLTWKFGRCHHEVNYGAFKGNKLLRADDASCSGVNNYGMQLVELDMERKKCLGKPIPTHLKLLRGNPGHSAACPSRARADVAPDVPEPPPFMIRLCQG